MPSSVNDPTPRTIRNVYHIDATDSISVNDPTPRTIRNYAAKMIAADKV